MKSYRKHAVLPDTQVRPGVRTDHLEWIGNYLAEKKPDVIVHLGDFADMKSLSSWDKGKKSAENARYQADIDAARDAMGRLMGPIQAEQRRTRGRWKPQLLLTLGNHEDRITRFVESNPELDGKLSIDDLGYADAGWSVLPFLKPVVVDGIAYCLTPDSLVLTTDLKWAPLGDVEIGDEIYGFDEEPSAPGIGRRFKTSVVESVSPVTAPVIRVILDSGESFRATPDHRIMRLGAGWGWAHVEDLAPGDRIPRVFRTWREESTREAGWLAGMFDGEGHVSKPNSKQGGIQVGCSQNPGPTMDRLVSELARAGCRASFHHYARSAAMIRLTGPSAMKVEVLGRIRPQRLISKLRPEMLGRMQKLEVCRVVAVEPAGSREVIQIQTNTRTLIADGFAHHNCHYFTSGPMGRPVASAKAMIKKYHQSCTMGHTQSTDFYAQDYHADGRQLVGLFAGTCYLHDEPYLGPQQNAQRRQIVIKHEVRHGVYDPMLVSLDYLERKYS